jgi:hypothetical protein
MVTNFFRLNGKPSGAREQRNHWFKRQYRHGHSRLHRRIFSTTKAKSTSSMQIELPTGRASHLFPLHRLVVWLFELWENISLTWLHRWGYVPTEDHSSPLVNSLPFWNAGEWYTNSHHLITRNPVATRSIVVRDSSGELTRLPEPIRLFPEREHKKNEIDKSSVVQLHEKWGASFSTNNILFTNSATFWQLLWTNSTRFHR